MINNKYYMSLFFLLVLGFIGCEDPNEAALQSFLDAANVSSMGELLETEDLSLVDKQIVGIPSEISKLKKLKKLNLTNNKITELPRSILELPDLKLLILTGNPIKVNKAYLDILSELKKKGVTYFDHKGFDAEGFKQDKKNKDGLTREQIDEDSLQKMLNWDVKKASFPPFNVSKPEKRFINELQKMIADKKFSACIGIESASYFFEHVLPIYHIWPAPFCGVKGAERSEFNAKTLVEMGYPSSSIFLFYDQRNIRKFLEKSDHHVLWHVSNSFKIPELNKVKKLGELTHGIDTDGLFDEKYVKKPLTKPYMGGISLSFSRFSMENYEPISKIKDFYKLDPTKKTILYLGTIGEWEFLDPSIAPKFVYKHTFDALEDLSKKYNLIIRPHPLYSQPGYEDFWQKLTTKFTIAPNGYFRSFIPLYQVADVVIGTPSAGGSTATSRPDVPLVQLLPEKTWTPFGKDIFNMHAVVAANPEFTLNKQKAVMVSDKDIIHSGQPIVDAVERALNESKAVKKAKKAEKQKYFKAWFGCIDGYEEYRVILNYLRYYIPDMKKKDFTNLEAIYKTFPKYSNPAFDIYKGQQCNMWDLYNDWK